MRLACFGQLFLISLFFKESSQKFQQRVINGTAAGEGKWNFVAALVSDNELWCGGSVLNDDTILTAAHCLVGKDPSFFKIYIGHASVSEVDSEYKFKADKFIVHSDYDEDKDQNDIGLIKLDRKIDFPSMPKVRRTCIPKSIDQLNLKDCTVMGWGKTEKAEFTEDLHEVKVPVLADEVCAKLNKKFVQSMMVCAGYLEGGKDSCQGDSGGPLVCSYKKHPAKVSQVGVVSFGKGCARPNSPGYYVRVTTYIDWIKSKAES